MDISNLMGREGGIGNLIFKNYPSAHAASEEIKKEHPAIEGGEAHHDHKEVKHAVHHAAVQEHAAPAATAK